MDNFETDNQDKSNLVGDAKLMSDAVDREQKRLRIIDEVRELKDSLRLMTSLVRTKYGNQDNLIYLEIEKAEDLTRGE